MDAQSVTSQKMNLNDVSLGLPFTLNSGPPYKGMKFNKTKKLQIDNLSVFLLPTTFHLFFISE